MELKLKLVTTSPGGWWVGGGWTKTKLMLFSTQVEVVVELKLELSLAIVDVTFDLIFNLFQKSRIIFARDTPSLVQGFILAKFLLIHSFRGNVVLFGLMTF